MARLGDLARLTALHASQLARRARSSVRGAGTIEIAAYRGFGTARRFYVHGRVLQAPGYTRAAASDPAWRNLLNTYRRAESDPVPYARVDAVTGEKRHALAADDEGFFGGWIELGEGAVEPKDEWAGVKLELNKSVAKGAAISVEAKVLIPPLTARFGVISDIDDTVIQSRVTSFLQAARTVMLGNALTRLPFEGVAKFYAALRSGATGKESNPLFYVSSSPWNIYDIIEDFLSVQGIPLGPLMLRDWDINLRSLRSGRHHDHKGVAIREILNAYPALPFILIGDSGQEDPEIYHGVVHDYPDRIIGVYIRDVVRTPQRSGNIARLADEISEARSMLLLVEDTGAASRDAARRGWIAAEKLDDVQREVAADRGVTGKKKSAPA